MAKGLSQKAGGLMSTRDAYTKAVTEGETDKSHADWYAENTREAPREEVPYNARWRNRKEEK